VILLGSKVLLAVPNNTIVEWSSAAVPSIVTIGFFIPKSVKNKYWVSS